MVRYNPDIKGIGELMRGPEMRTLMNLRALGGLEYARALAAAHVRTGDYERSLHTESITRGGPHKDRAEARIVADSDHAVLVEWYDDLHILARTAAAIEGTG